MNKHEMIASIHKDVDLTKHEIELVVDKFIEKVEETLASGDKVVLVGFGTFEVAVRKPKGYKHPATGKMGVIPEKKLPVFVAGKTFREKVL